MGVLTNLTTLVFMVITIAAVGKITFDPPKQQTSKLEDLVNNFENAVDKYSNFELLTHILRDYDVQMTTNMNDGWGKPVEIDGVYYVYYTYKGHSFRLTLA